MKRLETVSPISWNTITSPAARSLREGLAEMFTVQQFHRTAIAVTTLAV